MADLPADLRATLRRETDASVPRTPMPTVDLSRIKPMEETQARARAFNVDRKGRPDTRTGAGVFDLAQIRAMLEEDEKDG